MRKLWTLVGMVAVGTSATMWGCGTDGEGAKSGAGGSPAAQGGAAGESDSIAGGSAGTGGGGEGGQAGADDAAAGGSAGEAGSAGQAGEAGSPGLASLGSLVVLGDSIGDGGGQGPFYYELLKADLTTNYGAISYQNHAQGGSKTSALVDQIKALPSTLPSPVAVCITSGGNDMKDVFAQVALGADQAALAALGGNINLALDALLKPGRFGAGVAVHVYEANIYDASDGVGDYSAHGCPWAPNGIPAIVSDGFFAKWNGVIAGQVSAHGQTPADIHQLFYGHGYNHPPTWYANDCTHPNTTGHDELHRYFYSLITGETLP
jgi:hypothetical protein